MTTLPYLATIVFMLSALTFSLRAENILLFQDFSTCANPSGWTGFGAAISWDVDDIMPDAAALGSSMNGSCFAYFNDNALGATPLTATQRITSPTFDSSPYATITLDFDVHFRAPDFANAYLNVEVHNGTSWTEVAMFKGQDYDGDLFSDNVHQTIDISRFRSNIMRVRFGYNDAGAQTWWAGLDNIKVAGRGAIPCTAAQDIAIGTTCEAANTAAGIWNAPIMPSCTDSAGAGVWYRFTAPSTAVTIRSQAAFNDLITVYAGDCTTLIEIACANRDIYGFGSETLYLNSLTAGNTYYILLGAVQNTFGARSGGYCLTVQNGATPPITSPPANDWCANPLPLIVDGACLNGDIFDATFDGPIPTKNHRADASVWFTFVAPANGIVHITTDADFADNITVLSGNCASLTEVGDNVFGQELSLTNLTGGEVYYIQLSGFFSGIAGNYCIGINSVNSTPLNENCTDAILLNMGASSCTAANNELATYSETVHSSCDLLATASVWFKFNAPTSGKVYVSTGADFIHTATLWEGTCNSLTEKYCVYNPYRCDEAVLWSNLTSGQTYYLQISSAKMPFGYLYGDMCVRVTDGNTTPLRLKLKAYLQGAYNTSSQQMTFAITTNYLLPTEQPYDVAPWNYMGNECLASSKIDNVVDWVLIELRDSANPTVIISQKAALLYADGTIADKGKDGVDMPNTQTNVPYYVIVRHRNHLAVRSAAAITLPNVDALDFSNVSTIQGGNTQVALLSGNKYGLLAGDINGNGVISVTDYNIYTAQISAINLYTNADVNLDRNITVADFNMYQPNASKIGVTEIRY